MQPRHLGSHRSFTLWLLLIAVLAAAVRFYDLASFPPHVDENSNTGCAQQAAKVPLREATTLAYACSWKPPIFTVAQSRLLPLTADPFAAGRLLPALSGTVSAVLSVWLGSRLGGPVCGILAGLVYAFAPLAVLSERQVLHDGPLTAFGLAALLATWTAAERRSIGYGLVGAMCGFLAVNFKLTGLMVVPAMGALILAVWWEQRRCQPWWNWRTYAATLPALVTPVVGVGLLIALQPPGTLTKQVGEAWQPFGSVWPNAAAFADTVVRFFPFGLWVVCIIGAVLLVRRQPTRAVIVLSPVVTWCLPIILLGTQFPSYYALPAIPYIGALMAYAGSEALNATWVRALALGSVVLGTLTLAVMSVHLVLDYDHSPLLDFRWRHYSSGYGYREAARWIREHAEPGSLVAYQLGHSLFWVASGVDDPLPPGVLSAGMIEMGDSLPDLSEPVYVLVSPEYSPLAPERPGYADRIFQEHNPRAVIAQHYPRPGSTEGVSIWRIDPVPATGDGKNVVVQWSGWNGGWGWTRSNDGTLATPGLNVAYFILRDAGAISLSGEIKSDGAPQDVAVKLEGKVLQTVHVSTEWTPLDASATMPLPAGRYFFQVEASSPVKVRGVNLAVR